MEYSQVVGPSYVIATPQVTVASAASSNETARSYAGVMVDKGIFNCCGLIGLRNIYGLKPTTYEEKSKLAHFLFANFQNPGTLIYVLERHQLDEPMHEFLVEIGATQMGPEFPNLNYSDHYLSIWIVNVKHLTGPISKYLDTYGRVKSEPKPAAKAAKELA